MFDIRGVDGRRRPRRLFSRVESADAPQREPEEEQSPEHEEESRRAASAPLTHAPLAGQALHNFNAWERYPVQRRFGRSSVQHHRPFPHTTIPRLPRTALFSGSGRTDSKGWATALGSTP